MSTHLSPEEFVDVVDGTLGAGREKHLEQCDACQREVTELRALMSGVQAADQMPEPSPLFWEHFSQRVIAVTSQEPDPAPAPWWSRVFGARAWRPLVAVSTMAAVATLAILLRPAPASHDAAGAPAVVAAADDDGFDIAPDESFEFVTQLASDLSWDDLHELAMPTRDATAAVIDRLTPAQQAEFLRLLKLPSGGVE